MRNVTLTLAVLVAAVACSCLDDTDIESVDRAVGSWNVQWGGTVGVVYNGNPSSLIKTDPSNKWNAGAFTGASGADPQQITEGYVEFTTAENTTAKMVGLSDEPWETDWRRMDFAIRLKRNGTVAVFESGVLRGDNLTRYVAGDLFRIENVDGVVTYEKNGTTIYTSTTAPVYPLWVDSSFYTPGATINDAFLVSTELISWQRPVFVSIYLDELMKSGTKDGWNAGASSMDTLSGDGYLEFSTDHIDYPKMAGLSNDDPDPGWKAIDFAIRLKNNGTVAVFENGVSVGDNLATYAGGEIFRVEVTSGVVTYAKDGVVFFTSSQTPNFPLRVDTSFYGGGSVLRGFRVVPL